MSLFGISQRDKMLSLVAPITEKAGTERRIRAAVLKAKRKGPAASEFAQQQRFDRALAMLVRDIPVSAEISEWFRNEKLIPRKKRSWKTAIRNPVVISIALALAVIAGVVVYGIRERMAEFPGSATARKMLAIAPSMRGLQLEPLQAEAGALGDFFFMKYRLEHYDVPPEFADLRASAVRVFDDDEGHRVAQIIVTEKKMQFFLFPAERNPKDARPLEFAGWRYVEHEGWTAAVRVRNGVCFMAAIHGTREGFALYVTKQQAAATPSVSPR